VGDVPFVARPSRSNGRVIAAPARQITRRARHHPLACGHRLPPHGRLAPPTGWCRTTGIRLAIGQDHPHAIRRRHLDVFGFGPGLAPHFPPCRALNAKCGAGRATVRLRRQAVRATVLRSGGRRREVWRNIAVQRRSYLTLALPSRPPMRSGALANGSRTRHSISIPSASYGCIQARNPCRAVLPPFLTR
jgi:hypothetical protein